MVPCCVCPTFAAIYRVDPDGEYPLNLPDDESNPFVKCFCLPCHA